MPYPSRPSRDLYWVAHPMTTSRYPGTAVSASKTPELLSVSTRPEVVCSPSRGRSGRRSPTRRRFRRAPSTPPRPGPCFSSPPARIAATQLSAPASTKTPPSLDEVETFRRSSAREARRGRTPRPTEACWREVPTSAGSAAGSPPVRLHASGRRKPPREACRRALVAHPDLDDPGMGPRDARSCSLATSTPPR